MKHTFVASFALVGEATREVYRKRAALLSALLIPTVGLLLIDAFSTALKPHPVAPIFLALAYLPCYAIFATVCHRLVLLGENSLPHRWGMFWTERETRFLGWFIGIWFLYFGLSLPMGIIALFFSSMDVGWNTTWIASFVTYVVVAYFEGRFSLVLPATAIDKRSDFKESWRISRGKGMLIAIALVIPVMILIPLETLLYDTGVDELSPIADLVWLLISLPIFVIEIAIISLAYDKLASQDRR
ncbi:MAG: hypothetical protein ACR2QZ_14910 [Woeseiaceae bacterium]